MFASQIRLAFVVFSSNIIDGLKKQSYLVQAFERIVITTRYTESLSLYYLIIFSKCLRTHEENLRTCQFGFAEITPSVASIDLQCLAIITDKARGVYCPRK